MEKKKNRIWAAVALMLAALSIWAVAQATKDYSFNDFIQYIHEADTFWIVMAVICMIGFIVFEGLALLGVLKSFGYKRAVNKGIVYSAADIYFSAITPSATGGQPASAYYMMADGVPAAVSAVALLVNLVMYTASIMVIGIIAVILRPNLFLDFTPLSKFLIIIGYVILGGLMSFIILLIKREDWVHAIGAFIIRVSDRIRIIRNPGRFEKKLDKITQEYRDCAEMIDGQRGMLLKCFIFNFLQRSLQICVSVMIFLADGGKASMAVDIWVTHAFSVIGSNCIPVPGAMGVIDYLLLDGMNNLMSDQDAISLELTSRGISFYVCVLLCIVIVALGHFSINRRKSVSEGEDHEG
ncbi:MAG: flippase-like domain-containing protein [Lachnospiraceae bacterium]|nr:flippase-like domain-containing protein [Lachnospiraceae bacterium]